MSPLRWSWKSTVKLAEELNRQGYAISASTVADMLKNQDYSLQANRKRGRGPAIRIGMRNFNTLMNRRRRFNSEERGWFPSTPKRRNC